MVPFVFDGGGGSGADDRAGFVDVLEDFAAAAADEEEDAGVTGFFTVVENFEFKFDDEAPFFVIGVVVIVGLAMDGVLFSRSDWATCASSLGMA